MTETPTLEYRAAKQVGVSFPDRIIELIAMPYEEETVVEHQGRLVREVFSRGAFDGIERRANRVTVNRDHDITRTVGRAVKFSSRDEGLVAELRIAKTPLGDETLELAGEEILDASVGFVPMADGEQWENSKSLRRVVKAWLGHIAMTPDPAYEGARVLAVRSQALTVASGVVVAPNLAAVKAWGLEKVYVLTDR